MDWPCQDFDQGSNTEQPSIHALPDNGSATYDGRQPHKSGGRHHLQERPDGFRHRGATGEDVDEPSEETESVGGACTEEELRQQEVEKTVAENGGGNVGYGHKLRPGAALQRRPGEQPEQPEQPPVNVKVGEDRLILYMIAVG